MAENRAHKGESKEHRLKRFKEGTPAEAIDTVLNSIANFFNNEIRLTPEYYQTSLMSLGNHAVALTIGEAFFGRGREEDIYRKFLEMFIDGKTEDMQFSRIAGYIHDWRNIIAHQWIGSLGHQIAYDYNMEFGWKKEEDGVIFINPKKYCEACLGAFSAGGKIWDYKKLFSEEELEQIKQRIIEKYERR